MNDLPYLESRHISEPVTTVRPTRLGRNAGVVPLQSGYALPARHHTRVIILIDAGFSACLSRCNLNSLHQQIITLFNDKERFAADVSHELKNPIASIISNAENAIASAQSSSADVETFLAIKKQAIRMNKLISEISEAAIVDYDLVSATREKFDLSETLQNLVEFFENQNFGVLVSSNIQQNIYFIGLPDRIARVFINLIENALSFAGENGEVRVTLEKSWRQGIVISVEDTGAGVSETFKEDIFNRFFSAREGNCSATI